MRTVRRRGFLSTPERRSIKVSGDLYERIGAAADAALVPMIRLSDALVTAALDAAGAPKR